MKVLRTGKQTIYVLVMMFITSVALAGATPEFDGAYIKIKDGSYKELTAKKKYNTLISSGGMRYPIPKTHYVADKKGMIFVSSDEFDGVAIRGNYKFKFFSLHPLVTINPEKNERLLNNHGPAKKHQPFYIPGKEIGIRKSH